MATISGIAQVVTRYIASLLTICGTLFSLLRRRRAWMGQGGYRRAIGIY
jgi:hypothetical protein